MNDRPGEANPHEQPKTTGPVAPHGLRGRKSNRPHPGFSNRPWKGLCAGWRRAVVQGLFAADLPTSRTRRGGSWSNGSLPRTGLYWALAPSVKVNSAPYHRAPPACFGGITHRGMSAAWKRPTPVTSCCVEQARDMRICRIGWEMPSGKTHGLLWRGSRPM